jgi:hypothetical protein
MTYPYSVPRPFRGDQLDVNNAKAFALKWSKFSLQTPAVVPAQILCALALKKANRSNSELVDRYFVLTSAAFMVTPTHSSS